MLVRIILARILWALPLLFGVSILSFVLLRALPGSYFASLRLNPQISEETIKEMERKYHLNEPVYKQYLWWVWNLLHGDLGYSFYYHAPVGKVIASRVKATLVLSLVSLVLVWVVVLPAGVYAVRYRPLDPVISVTAFVFMCLPTFFLAFVLLFLAMLTGALPLGGMYSLLHEDLPTLWRWVDLARHLIIPALVISLPAIGGLFRIVRGSLKAVMSAKFILNARAKGFPEDYILWHHALPNALHPLIVIFGYQLADVLSGAALTEIICNWPGMGTMFLSAVQSQDVYLVMAGLMLSAVMLIFGNLVSDILLYWLDPRVREGVVA